MLRMDQGQKILLHAIGALELDIDGDQVLVGLTAAETSFVLAYTIPAGPKGTVAETILCLSLRRQHLLARLRRLDL